MNVDGDGMTLTWVLLSFLFTPKCCCCGCCRGSVRNCIFAERVEIERRRRRYRKGLMRAYCMSNSIRGKISMCLFECDMPCAVN